MSTRTDSARRLELSQVEELGNLVTGKVRGMAVTLEGQAPFTACVVDLGAAVPIARMLMRSGDLNHPDTVLTGDAAFDDRMQVTALASYAPTLELLLSTQPIRKALLDFFARYPDAEFVGARLRVRVADVTQQVVGDALKIAELVAERFAAIGFLETEEAARLPVRPGLPKSWRRMALGIGISANCFVGFAHLFGVQADANGLWMGICFVLVGVAVAAVLNHAEGS